MKLLVDIGKNCHRIVVWPGLNLKMKSFLEHSRREDFFDHRVIKYMEEFRTYLEKWKEYLDFTRQEMEITEKEYPGKDRHIVQAALIFKEQILPDLVPEYEDIYIVTEDDRFFKAMQKSQEIKDAGIIPLRPRGALKRSKER